MNENTLGSYLKDDVEVLLKEIEISETKVGDKEKLIQSKGSHYSEMISPEYIPTDEYIKVFYEAMSLNKKKVAENIIQLSNYISEMQESPILVSLARAGTPIGVLLQRTLKEEYNLKSSHYTISIIRDKEIDENALNYILLKESEKYGQSAFEASKRIIFVDGWTGKGVINRELTKFISSYNGRIGTEISSDLFVLADISGKAEVSATQEDYLIPSAALNSTVSGLISRSILNKMYIGDNDFHGCKYYKEFEKNDLSLWYIEEIMKEIRLVVKSNFNFINNNVNNNIELSNKVDLLLKTIGEKYNISDINHIKPGVGETTRVLLRRIPDVIILRDLDSIHTKHIVKLAKDKGAKIIEDKNLLYSAVGIIKSLKEEQ